MANLYMQKLVTQIDIDLTRGRGTKETSAGHTRTISSVILSALMMAALGLCFFSTNRKYDVGNDPLGQLIATENILKNHTLSVDNLDPKLLSELTYHVVCEKNGRSYYYFPFGTTILALPLVAVLDHLGWSMLRDEAAAEHIASAILTVVLIGALYGIGRRFLPPIPAAILTGLMWLGTSLSSVGGLALWAHLTSTTFATLSIWLALRDPAVRSWTARILLGLLLFLAYLSRPTMAVLIPMMLFFLACHSWRSSLYVGLVAGFCLVCFFGANVIIFGEARPIFYAGGRLGTTTYLLGLYGNLLGVSRGLLVFSPFLLVPLWFAPRVLRSGQRALLILALAWPVLHLLVISDFPRWWAGYSYGPRYTMEVLPGLFVLLCLSWSLVRGTGAAVTVAAVLASTGAFAVFAHAVEGMNNPATSAWSAAAQIDKHPEIALDWRFPQWMATESRNRDMGAYVATLPSGERNITFMAPAALILGQGGSAPRFLRSGWGEVEPWGTWSTSREAHIAIRLGDPVLRHVDIEVQPLLTADRAEQDVTLEANGCVIASRSFSLPLAGRSFIGGDIPEACVPSDGKVDLALDVDRVVTPASSGVNGDERPIGIGVKMMMVRTSGETSSWLLACHVRTPVDFTAAATSSLPL